jgi:hypothetical protein
LRNMPEQQRRILAKGRRIMERRRGEDDKGCEVITLKTVDGSVVQPVGSFIYLGSKITRGGGVTNEIRRRIGIASIVFQDLSKIWCSSISVRLKATLYKTLIQSILLYNAECWAVKKTDLDILEGFHFRCLKEITKKERGVPKGRVVDKASREDVAQFVQMEDITTILSVKRVCWYGHLLRASTTDPARIEMLDEDVKKSQWWKLLRQDLARMGVSEYVCAQLTGNRELWSRITNRIRGISPDTKSDCDCLDWMEHFQDFESTRNTVQERTVDQSTARPRAENRRYNLRSTTRLPPHPSGSLRTNAEYG